MVLKCAFTSIRTNTKCEQDAEIMYGKKGYCYEHSKTQQAKNAELEFNQTTYKPESPKRKPVVPSTKTHPPSGSEATTVNTLPRRTRDAPSSAPAPAPAPAPPSTTSKKTATPIANSNSNSTKTQPSKKPSPPPLTESDDDDDDDDDVDDGASDGRTVYKKPKFARIMQNKYNRYEYKPLKFLFDPRDRRVYGVQEKDGSVRDLDKTERKRCRRYKWGYKTKDKYQSESEDEESEDSDVLSYNPE